MNSTTLQLLGLSASPQSVDYVANKPQFHLFNLLTEQRHPKTWNLSFVAQPDLGAALEMLLSVDEDISRKVGELTRDPAALELAVEAVVEAIRSGHKIYFYGCGATGRLAKQMESTFWRPFWARVKDRPCWQKLRDVLPEDIGDRCIGEMTGGDRALVSSLEGFEDLQLLGRLQLKDRAVECGDTVFCVTEGGETSSVIGTILGAVDQYRAAGYDLLRDAPRRLFFVYNNPDEVLRTFERSASVLDNNAITKINLTTGPQAITGSTRMQATTIETFVLGAVLEEAIRQILRGHLSHDELQDLGYGGESSIAERLRSFQGIKAAVDTAVPDMERFADLEAGVYRAGQFATYFAKKALITVFIDSTERSPTFRLYPLDRAQDEQRKCWLQVWTEASGLKEAWRKFLGRPFRGLESAIYREAFEHQVEDPYLRKAALHSLANAGNDQELLYDFSFSRTNIERRGPGAGDVGVAVCIDEELEEAANSGSSFYPFLDSCRERGAHTAVVCVAASEDHGLQTIADGLQARNDAVIPILLPPGPDPLTLSRQIALKMLLNAHSTAIMAALGRVVGNTMTNVSPSNLKLIGRATYLILTHVNDTFVHGRSGGVLAAAEPLDFAEANAVLFDAIEYVRNRELGQTAEVALSIVRILESVRRQAAVSWDEASTILAKEGLAAYLLGQNPSLARLSPTA